MEPPGKDSKQSAPNPAVNGCGVAVYAAAPTDRAYAAAVTCMTFKAVADADALTKPEEAGASETAIMAEVKESVCWADTFR